MKHFDENSRGSLLVIVMAVALICSVIVYALLYYSIGAVRQSQALKQRDQMRYAAEAALIWAQQQLWVNPAWSPAAGSPVPLAIIGVETLTVTIPPCAAPPCPTRAIQVTASSS